MAGMHGVDWSEASPAAQSTAERSSGDRNRGRLGRRRCANPARTVLGLLAVSALTTALTIPAGKVVTSEGQPGREFVALTQEVIVVEPPPLVVTPAARAPKDDADGEAVTERSPMPSVETKAVEP